MSSRIDLTKLPAKVVGMSNADYHAERKFDGRSFLCAVMQHGGEVQLWMDQGKSLFAGSAATATGSEWDEIVTGILEGRSFDSLVVVPPDDVLGANGSRSTKAYREWAATQTAVCVTADKLAQYRCMYDGMRFNEACASLMEATIGTQWSVFFEAFGHRLKVRPDGVTSDLWWDLKTTSAQWPDVFRSCMKYGYAEQAWLYTQGAKALGYGDFKFPFVFVQTIPPYRTRVRTLPDALVEAAGQRLVSVMEEVRLRRITGAYEPADAGDITELQFPAWALRTEEVVEL